MIDECSITNYLVYIMQNGQKQPLILVTKSHYTYNYMYMYIPYDLYHAQMDIDQSIH